MTLQPLASVMELPPPISRLESLVKQYDSKGEIASVLSFLINDDRLCYPWGRLYRRSVIERYGLRFDESMRFAEDNVFVWQYLCHVGSMYVNFAALDYHKDCVEKVAPYHLTLDEMDYIDGRLFSLLDDLEAAYGIRLCLDAKQLMHVLFVKDMLQLTASQWYEYYKKYHPLGTEKEGYDFIMQTIYYMTLANLSKADKRQQSKLLEKLDNFIDKPFAMMMNSSIKTRFLIPIIKMGCNDIVVKLINSLMK